MTTNQGSDDSTAFVKAREFSLLQRSKKALIFPLLVNPVFHSKSIEKLLFKPTLFNENMPMRTFGSKVRKRVSLVTGE